MSDWQRWLADYLGLTASGGGVSQPSGGSHHFRLAWQNPTAADWPPLVWVILGLSAATLIILAYRRDAAHLSRGQRSLLTGLRLSAFIVVAILVGRPAIEIDEQVLPTIVVMVDTSASMGTIDRVPPKPDEAAVRSSATEATSSGSFAANSRIEQVQAVLFKEGTGLLPELARGHLVQLVAFDATTRVVWQSAGTQSIDRKVISQAISSLAATGTETLLASSLKKVLEELRGSSVDAVVVLSDGVSSQGEAERLSAMASVARSVGVQVFTVGVGTSRRERDIELNDVFVDDVAFVRDSVGATIRLRGTGIDTGTVVRLINAGSGEVLAQQAVSLPVDGSLVTLELSFVPETVGKMSLKIEAVRDPAELDIENNSALREIDIREDRLKVLLVDSRPRYEFRFVKQLFEREKSVELSTLLLSSDAGYSQEDKTAISLFPVKQDQLLEYDVIVWGDVNLGQLSPGIVERVKDYVTTGGGGLVMVAGEKFNPGRYGNSPFEDLLPFTINRDGATTAQRKSTSEPFQPVQTIDGRVGSRLFRFGENEAESQAVWDRFPPLRWLVEIPDVEPGVTVLAEHPTKRGTEQPLPVIMLQRVGAGKVLFQATDETWRWRFRAGDQYFGRYWLQALRLVSRRQGAGQDRSAELTATRQVYSPEEPVELRASFLGTKLLGTVPGQLEARRVVVQLEAAGREIREIELTPAARSKGVFESRLSSLPPGRYHAWISEPGFKKSPPSVDFVVSSESRELILTTPDLADLRQTAQRTDAAYYNIEEAHRLVEKLPPARPVTIATSGRVRLWDRWEPLLLVVGLLACEWGLRMRWRLV